MKIVCTIILCLAATTLLAQNVGIGNPAPASRLEINNNTLARPSISIVDSFTSGLGNIRFRNTVRTNRNMELSALTFSAFARDSYLDVKSDSLIIATFRGNGNLGVGILSPAERVDINGNMNITGAIKLNGNAGTAGQVLTSNGTGAPTWQPSAAGYAANGRLMLMVNRTPFPGKVEDSLNLGTAVYNTFGAGVSIGPQTITINEAGLYEIEGKLYFDVGVVGVENPIIPSKLLKPYASMYINADFGATTFNFPQIAELIDEDSQAGTTQAGCSETMPFRWLGYLPAGTVLVFIANIKGYTTDTCCDFPPGVGEGYIGILRVN